MTVAGFLFNQQLLNMKTDKCMRGVVELLHGVHVEVTM